MQRGYQSERKPEPLLFESVERFTQLPLHYPRLQEAYDEHEALFWTAKEIDYPADLKDWARLTENERWFIELVLAFFAGVDGIVAENISQEATVSNAHHRSTILRPFVLGTTTLLINAVIILKRYLSQHYFI